MDVLSFYLELKEIYNIYQEIRNKITDIAFFILKVTTHSATDALGLRLNTMTLFYCKIREMIVERSSADEELLSGKLRLTRVIFAILAKAMRVNHSVFFADK